MSDEFLVEVAGWERLGNPAHQIREAVFVHEQGVPADLEYDDMDGFCRHALIRSRGGEPLATGRLLPDGHIGRVAVMADWRAKGLGRQIMLALMQEAQRLGHRDVALNAQVSAVPFYLGLGFKEYGEVFMEAGIPHQAMKRALSSPE